MEEGRAVLWPCEGMVTGRVEGLEEVDGGVCWRWWGRVSEAVCRCMMELHVGKRNIGNFLYYLTIVLKWMDLNKKTNERRKIANQHLKQNQVVNQLL